MSLYLNWTVLRWDEVFVYSQKRRQKKRAIWMRSAIHWARGEEAAAAAACVMRPRGVAFSLLEGGS